MKFLIFLWLILDQKRNVRDKQTLSWLQVIMLNANVFKHVCIHWQAPAHPCLICAKYTSVKIFKILRHISAHKSSLWSIPNINDCEEQSSAKMYCILQRIHTFYKKHITFFKLFPWIIISNSLEAEKKWCKVFLYHLFGAYVLQNILSLQLSVQIILVFIVFSLTLGVYIWTGSPSIFCIPGILSMQNIKVPWMQCANIQPIIFLLIFHKKN